MKKTIAFASLLFYLVVFSLMIVDSRAEERLGTTSSELTEEIRRSIDAGLDFLASRVQPDGSMASNYSAVAVSALAGTAFLCNGSAPGRGKYGAEVEKIKNYILSCVHSTSGYISSQTSGGNMYSHGFATMFLAEVLGMTPDPKVEESLRKAVRLIEYSQGVLGGWRYDPRPSESDISVTICQVMALRAARNAGIPVDPNVIDKALECVRSCANPDGGFNYIAGMKGGSAFPRSAAGVCILYYLGEYDAPEVLAGLKYLSEFVPGTESSRMGASHIYYGYYYGTQAMFQAGGDYWNRWYPAVARWLMRQQMKDGSFPYSMGSDYATAMASIILQVPYRYLPILQR